nr:PD-(D/E)XK nuclease family protein [uncultured Undibacterium sp.]
MARITRLIPVSAQFWNHVAREFIQARRLAQLPVDLFSTPETIQSNDFSDVRVVVPTFEHAHLLLRALSQELGSHFIPPRIQTMFAWLGMQPPHSASVNANSERLMRLYSELRQHAWLKKLFGAKRNTDLLPLAQTLLTLSDELTQVWLAKVLDSKQEIHTEKMQATWHEALAQLPLPVQKIVSDETQLVWTLWQGQLDQHDQTVQEFQHMMRLAQSASADLFWIAPTMPNALEEAFLQAYQLHQQVHLYSIDWYASAVPESMRLAWNDLCSSEAPDTKSIAPASFDWQRLRLCELHSLEQEAEQAAQTIVEWIQAGKQKIAVIAQDRVVSRRLRALLERANVIVADETGWKLSTTRAAAALAAWFELLATRADTIALLDFLKSPFLPCQLEAVDAADPESSGSIDKADLIMDIELVLRRNNVVGGWDAVLSTLERQPQAREWVAGIARLAHTYASSSSASRRSLKDWTTISMQSFDTLGMQALLQQDVAGAQVLQMLQTLGSDCHGLDTHFSFSEWRAFINLQMEATPFKLEQVDQRVVMLPLNGARLRHFDAVYLIGGDAKHLPSKAQETLFFTNAVRRECGLVTREERQLQQQRDFAELILSNTEVVLSWQSQINGELNAVSPWVEQVNLALARQNLAVLNNHGLPLAEHRLQAQLPTQPKPSAVALMPTTLSASGLSSLIACPYQFFAGRMLKLAAIDELSDMPEKRDYGDWLHAILKSYHDQLQKDEIPLAGDRSGLLNTISDTWFARVLKHSPAALGYSVRWRKVIPAYVEWANQHEADGWQFAFGEIWAEAQLQWDEGEIKLRGRVDRIDERHLDNGEVERAVLDYKTKTKSSLKTRLKYFDDHQLAFYGLLQPVIESVAADGESETGATKLLLEAPDTASYVALELEREKTGEVEAQEYSLWKIELEQAIRKNMQAIQHGAALPAQGVESVCQYCDVRGLCRKGAW